MSEPIQQTLATASGVRVGRYVVLALLLGAVGIATRQWLNKKPEEPPFVVVSRGDIAALTLASGRIVPREEVFVRSLVAGVLAELHVQPGDRVKKGDQIALVRVVADPVLLSEAHGRVRLAEEKVARAQRELARLQRIQDGVGLSAQELARAEDTLRETLTELDSARERERYVKQGAQQREPGMRSTRVVAPIDGTVLAVPVAIGDMIGDTNSYRDGTTLAVIADMNTLLFKGQLEEAHVGKLRIGMPAQVRVGALEDGVSPGKLLWIAPRATIESPGGASPAPSASSNASGITPLTANSTGITRFELWVELERPPPDARAGYSATAELKLAERTNATLIEERALRFADKHVLANVINDDGSQTERKLEVGISDGLRIELKSGLHPGERVALPQ